MKTPISTARKIPPKRILVVDDEPLVANTIRMVLVIGGHSVDIAGDGESALAGFEPGKYDLVITDYKLPAMDGLELARAIKQCCPAQPIMLITAYAEAIAKDQDGASNIDALLGKPFPAEELHAAIFKIFSAPDKT